MDDAYTPALKDFEFTEIEKAAITSVLATDNPWTLKRTDPLYKLVQEIKMKIQDFHLERHNYQCCYCRLNLRGAGPFNTDREHILPKSKPIYRDFTFTIWNLGVSCKRCNMEYKKERVDFVIDGTDLDALQTSKNYRLIHPNFDNYVEHISHSLIQVDGSIVQKFTKREGSDKAEYTYTFFNLRGLEVDGFDEAQGASEKEEVLSEGALEARALARRYGQ